MAGVLACGIAGKLIYRPAHQPADDLFEGEPHAVVGLVLDVDDPGGQLFRELEELVGDDEGAARLHHLGLDFRDERHGVVRRRDPQPVRGLGLQQDVTQDGRAGLARLLLGHGLEEGQLSLECRLVDVDLHLVFYLLFFLRRLAGCGAWVKRVPVGAPY